MNILKSTVTMINLGNEICPKFEMEKPECIAHADNMRICTINNCEKLYTWLCDTANRSNDKWIDVFHNKHRFLKLKCSSRHIRLNKE